MRKLHGILFLVLLVLISVTSLAISSSRGIIDPFVHGDVASVSLSLQNGHIDFNKHLKTIPGFGFLVMTLSQLTALEPDVIEYLPIAGTLLLLTAFVAARSLVRNNLLVAISVASVLILRWLPPTLSTIWTHSFGFSLFLLFVLIVAILQRNEREVRWPTQVTLWLLFLGVHFYSYTVELWIIAFLGLIVLVRFFRKEPWRSPTTSLFLACVITFLFFQGIIYQSYIPHLETSSEALTLGFEQFFSIFSRVTPSLPYVWVPPVPPFYLLVAQIVWYLLLFVPITLVFLHNLSRTRGRRRYRAQGQTPSVTLAFFLVWFADIPAYALMGAVTIGILRYATFSAPFFSTSLINTHMSGRTSVSRTVKFSSPVTTYSLVLVAVSVLIFASVSFQGNTVISHSKYSEGKIGGQWLLSHVPEVNHIFSDHHTQGQFAIAASKFGLDFWPDNLYDSSSFSYLVNPSLGGSEETFFGNEYVVINLALADYKTTAGGWTDFEPLRPYLSTVENRSDFLKIYDKGDLWIFQGV